MLFFFFFTTLKSIEEQNFRYTGARLCRLLDSIDPTPNSLFRRLLCCKLQYNDTELIQFMNDNETHKVRNTTLFLAELYIQLQNVSSKTKTFCIWNIFEFVFPPLFRMVLELLRLQAVSIMPSIY